MSVEENLQTIESVDKAFNDRDWDSFDERHLEDVISYSPMTPEPTRDLAAHREAVKGLLGTFPDFRMERQLSFGQGDWVCATYTLTGTHKGPLPGPGGKMIPPTDRTVRISFCTAVRFEGGKIAEEHVFFDRLAMLGQLGVAP
ncbi:MAG: ester cyclase [Thermoplasmata archaeon]